MEKKEEGYHDSMSEILSLFFYVFSCNGDIFCWYSAPLFTPNRSDLLNFIRNKPYSLLTSSLSSSLVYLLVSYEVPHVSFVLRFTDRTETFR